MISVCRSLPGQDSRVDQVEPESILAMFDTSVCPNPSKSVLGRGIKSWARFGLMVTGKERQGETDLRL